MARWGNPLGFRPLPVIIFVTITYIALFAVLLSVHLTVPNYPKKTPAGTNLTQAWADLEHISRQFHPYNSHANDDVRKYLLSRARGIVTSKGLGSDQVNIIDDHVSNATFSSGNTAVYFEGTNIIIAIRGSEDKESIPLSPNSPAASRAATNGGVLVNAHYDSVSTGFGATDDGVGVVTVLQLLSYFTESRNWPKSTVVLLLNNGEEDFLNGAKAFMRHPISQVPHTFLNLEGAGAGGRATLFRSTDTEVTRFYKQSGHPFGTVISSDGFKKRLIRSETDYVVFNGELGLRGLDVAFIEPRARYHTVEDSTRETSLNSVWHMLDAAISTVSGLASDVSTEFNGDERAPRHDGKVDAGSGTDAVWFDLLGKAFVIFRLHTLFALNVTLLVVAPLTLIGLTVALSKSDKNYLFARKKYIHSSDDDEPVHLNGWRGVFRFPVAFVVATAAIVGLAYLVVRINPHIVYSSPFAVWSMTLSAWSFLLWFILRGASVMRPSALQRLYSLIWIFSGSFVLLTGATVFAHNYQVAGGYFLTFYFAAVFFALVVSYVELFFLPKKSAFATNVENANESRRGSEAPSRPLTGTTNNTRTEERPELDDDATETTSLLRGDRRSFRRYGSRRQSISEGTDHDHGDQPSTLDKGTVFNGEQEWSGKLPSWLWILQFLLLVPFNVILVGQVALLLTSALYQTPADGSSSLLIYIAFATLTVLLLAPAGPFIHRFTYHVPTFLFFVCVGTAIYNLVAFPFSREHRLKVYFVQQVDLASGANQVSLTGLDGYVQSIIKEIPSAQGKQVNCTAPDIATRKELTKCAWEGLPAHVVSQSAAPFSNHTYLDTWLNYTITTTKGANNASIRVAGKDTRACRILFDTPIVDLAVDGGVSDPRFNATGPNGSREVRLWHREWSQPWNVSVTWDRSKNSTLSGSIVCLWADANEDAIPAFDEIRHYLPVWAIATKISDGLVEGSKRFKI